MPPTERNVPTSSTPHTCLGGIINHRLGEHDRLVQWIVWTRFVDGGVRPRLLSISVRLEALTMRTT